MSRRVQYLIGVPAIVVLWVPLSRWLVRVLFDAEDPANGHPVSEAWLIRAIWNFVSFPMQELISLDWIRVHFGSRALEKAAHTSIFINGLFWGIILVFLFRCAIQYFGRRKLGSHDAA